MKRQVLWVGLCIFGFTNLSAQYQNLKFENYSALEGLSSSTCSELYQDSKGFMWFGTIDGLNKFDGYRFTIYRPVYGDSNSIGGNRITAIAEDATQNLWIGTSTGLNRFDQKTQHFQRIDLSKLLSRDLSQVVINCLLFHHEMLWVGTNIGLVQIDLSDRDNLFQTDITMELYSSAPDSKFPLDQQEVVAILPLDSGVAIGTEGTSLNVINTIKETVSYIQIAETTDFGLDHLPKSFLLDDSGALLYGNDLSRMAIYNVDTKEFQLKNYTDGMPVPVFDLYQDDQGMIWASTDGYGIFLLGPDKALIQQIQHDSQDPTSLPNNQPSKIIQDEEGIYWIATYNEGVCKLSLRKSAFAHVLYRSDSDRGLSSRSAQSVLEDKQGRIWVGTDGGGLNLLDQKSGKVNVYRHQENNPASISSDKIVYMEESLSGKLWISTWDGGLNLFDPSSGRAHRFTYRSGDPHSIGQNTVWYATEDKNGVVWCGTQSVGLNAYVPEEDRFYRFDRQAKGQQLLSDMVFSLLIDSQNQLLIGTDAGLQVLHLDSLSSLSAIEQLPLVNTPRSHLSGFRVNHMAEQQNRTYWIGTDLGLYHLNSKLEFIKRYTTNEGLPSNLIVGVVADGNQSVWLTTKSGLSRLDLQNDVFKNFNIHDGIQGMEFQSKSIFRTADGRILAGGINGMNVFRPEEVQIKEEMGKPAITGLRVLNTEVEVGELFDDRVLLDEPIWSKEEVVLYHNEGFVTFDFVTLHLSNPERVSYAHRMVGVNDDWVFIKDNRSASYSNLVSGKYTFEVMSAIDENWAEAKVSRIGIEVLPPPWKTWWAYLIYAVLVGGLLWLVSNIYMQRAQEERQRELDQMKLRFFMNVSHEFRTPLTLILNPVDKIISSYQDSEVVKGSAYTIQRSARKLMKLVNQLLDFRKLDMGKAPLDPINDDVVKFVEDVYQFFEDLAKSKSIEMNFDSEMSSYFMWFDPDKLEKILGNLLSNALKFTPHGGMVWIKLELKEKRQFKDPLRNGADAARIEISVKDTGVGLKKEHQASVFNRFFHVDNTQTGTGIGLNFTKALVEQHDGEIRVYSEYGKGSTFMVSLPVNSRSIDKARKSNKEARNSIKELDIDMVKSLEYDLAIAEGNEGEIDEETGTQEKSILIVEDNKELRSHLKSELRAIYKIREAGNGKEGLEKANKYFPDIIISDVMMPEMDGFAMCSALKSNSETSHIPIILLTARSLEEDRLEGYQTGADAYLPKPFNIMVLKARVKNLLDAKEKMKERFLKKTNILPASELTTNSLDEQFLDKSTQAILDHIDTSDFGLEQLLEIVGVSRSHFYRKIQSLTGQNPSNFIRTVRLKYAAELLKQKKHSIKEVAFKAGFNSTAYFSKTFKELFGMTPNEFMEKTDS